jgi:hypothetical protein
MDLDPQGEGEGALSVTDLSSDLGMLSPGRVERKIRIRGKESLTGREGRRQCFETGAGRPAREGTLDGL